MFQVPKLSGMLKVFNELTHMRCYWVHITLDLPKNTPNVAIAVDQRQVRYEYYIQIRAIGILSTEQLCCTRYTDHHIRETLLGGRCVRGTCLDLGGIWQKILC